MSKQSERVMAWRKNTKAKILAAFGGRCCICGYNKSNRSMDFHHLDPNDKEFHWGTINGNIRGWATIAAEMKKCVLVCSNCHGEIHDGITQVPENAQRFDETLIPVVLLKLRTRRLKTKRRKDRYEGVDIQALYEEHKNYRTVGDMFGVTGAAIKRRIQFLQTGKY